MLYLISLCPENFVTIERIQEDVRIERTTSNDGIKTFIVDKPIDVISTEMFDDGLTTDFGEYITTIMQELNVEGFLLHFNVLLVRYNGSLEMIKQVVSSVVDKNIKASIVELTAVQVVNFNSVEENHLKWITR